jgi:hypothetical protein
MPAHRRIGSVRNGNIDGPRFARFSASIGIDRQNFEVFRRAELDRVVRNTVSIRHRQSECARRCLADVNILL